MTWISKRKNSKDGVTPVWRILICYQSEGIVNFIYFLPANRAVALGNSEDTQMEQHLVN